ncbi:MAG: hypothetical protein KAH07_00880 [Flavobacteriaceae bacterium]|nr:hypothetical protein [Flavobacteriaceae bacterium]
MSLILLFIVGIVACFFIAKAILKYVPKKVQPVISIVLYSIAALLTYLSYDAVMKPIKFNKEKIVRFTNTIDQLKMIREAQSAHKSITGKFCAKGANLVSFIDTARFAVTAARNETKIVDVGGGITNEVEFRVVDTTGYTDVRANFVGRNYKEMMKVPGTDKEFTISLGEIPRTNGIMASIYEVKVAKADVLVNMDSDLIRLEEMAFADNEVKGKNISVGSLAEVSDKGNWPPTYDQKDIAQQKK